MSVFRSILFSFIFLVGLCTPAQVFIPMGFWQPQYANLLISDGATYNYGSIATNTNVDKIFTLTNTTSVQATLVAGAAFSSALYTFKGGSFPGTGGNCTATLVGYGICNFVVTARSAVSGGFSDTVTINYKKNAGTISTTRAVTAAFTSNPTKLEFINTAAFIKVNTCVAVTIQAQDNSGNPISVGVNTTVTLAINNAINSNFFTTNTCVTTTTSQTITAGTNSVLFYFRSTTGNQTGIFIGSATGLIAATQNVNITNTSSKLLLIAPPQAKVNFCNPMTVFTTDANGLYSAVPSNVIVNMTTTGSNIFYTNATCTTVATSVTITTGNDRVSVYTMNLTAQTATVTATDAAAALTPSSESIIFSATLVWWDTNWTKRIRIDINNLDQAASFTNQPVLVFLTPTLVNYADFKTNGADVRFVAADNTTVLPHEIELWNNTSTSQIWVGIPAITSASAADYFYMYYNNPAAPDGQNKNGVWPNYWSVWHLNENPTGPAPQYLDSTVNARNGTAVNSPGTVDGIIGLAADLSGTTDSIRINQDLAPVIGNTSTLSCWMKTTQIGNNTFWQAPGITGIEQAGGANDIFFGWIDASGFIGVLAGNGAAAKSNFVINNNAWRHLTITRSSTTGTVEFYINGVLNNTGASEAGIKTLSFDLLGEIGDTSGAVDNYVGQLDEVRIFSSVQSAARIKSDFKFMMNTNLIYALPEIYP